MSSEALLFDADQHYYEPRDCFARYMSRADHPKAHVALVTAGAGGVVGRAVVRPLARVVFFRVSEQPAFVTEETINVSGGRYMRP